MYYLTTSTNNLQLDLILRQFIKFKCKSIQFVEYKNKIIDH